MATVATYRIRPGRLSDVRKVGAIYTASFHHDTLLDILFPRRHELPRDFAIYLPRLLSHRLWTPTYLFTVLADERDDEPVGFAMWKRPWADLSFYERWISPYNWLAPIVRACLTIRDYLSPVRSMATATAGKYARTVDVLEPGILNTDRRRQAWYLSLLSVTPKLQGTGLGSLLIRDGLREVDARGKASWLVGLNGTDRFYERHGFKEVARANVGELKDWDGGIIMFRE